MRSPEPSRGRAAAGSGPSGSPAIASTRSTVGRRDGAAGAIGDHQGDTDDDRDLRELRSAAVRIPPGAGSTRAQPFTVLPRGDRTQQQPGDARRVEQGCRPLDRPVPHPGDDPAEAEAEGEVHGVPEAVGAGEPAGAQQGPGGRRPHQGEPQQAQRDRGSTSHQSQSAQPRRRRATRLRRRQCAASSWGSRSPPGDAAASACRSEPALVGRIALGAVGPASRTRRGRRDGPGPQGPRRCRWWAGRPPHPLRRSTLVLGSDGHPPCTPKSCS